MSTAIQEEIVHPDGRYELAPEGDDAIMVANIIVLGPMLLNSHAGTKYGIPYPVFARASFGVFGANLPALMRAGVACGWVGIQTWIGGAAALTVEGRGV